MAKKVGSSHFFRKTRTMDKYVCKETTVSFLVLQLQHGSEISVVPSLVLQVDLGMKRGVSSLRSEKHCNF